MSNHNDADGPPATPETGPRLVISLCGSGSCPTIYRTDRGTVLVQGAPSSDVAVGDGEAVVEIPEDLLLEAVERLRQRRESAR
jgi:hypothetical protein